MNLKKTTVNALVGLIVLGVTSCSLQNSDAYKAGYKAGWAANDKATAMPIADIQSVNVGKTYKHVQVILDGITYKKCVFTDVIFLFKGDGPIRLYDCTLNGPLAIYDAVGHSVSRMLLPYIQPEDGGKYQNPTPTPTPTPTPEEHDRDRKLYDL